MTLSGFPAVDAAIGLIAVFFLLSTVLSAINEGIANILGWRAKTLEDAVRNMLGDPQAKQGVKDFVNGGWRRIGKLDPPEGLTGELFNHWRIAALVRDTDDPHDRRRRTRPSYLPPRAFSLALAETIARTPKPGEPDPDPSTWELADHELFARLEAVAEHVPEGRAKVLVTKAVKNADHTLEGFRGHVEHAFDDAMERASGWYKRKVQFVLLVLSILVAIGLNVDTVRIGQSLWNDQAVRAAVIAQANARNTDAVKQVQGLPLPVGWGQNTPPNLFGAIPGWLITIAALQLGAPFWFDLLSRLARLRGGGVPERPRSLNDTAGTIERERVARRAVAEARVLRQQGQPAPATGDGSDNGGPPAAAEAVPPPGGRT